MQQTPQKKPSFRQITHSVLSALIGIQKQSRAEKDFHAASWKIYAGVGIVAVLVFIGVIIGVVKWILI